MANVQIMRQQNTSQIIKNATRLDQKQSLEVVQTMLHSAISSVTYLRELFPSKAYISRWYEYRDTVLPYKEYAAAAAHMPLTQDEAKGPRVNIPILQHKRSKRVDVFLDWLENTAFEELKTGDLRAFQILVHPDKDRRNEVLETYTFTIQYAESDDGVRIPSGLDVNGAKQTAVTVQASNIALQQVMRSIHGLCESMPQLPLRRLVSMKLCYDPDTNRAKQLAGFIPCDDGPIYFAQGDGFEKCTTTQRHDSGYHSTILKVSHLQISEGGDDDEQAEAGRAKRLPNKLTFSAGAPHDADIEVTETIKETPMVSRSASLAVLNPTRSGPSAKPRNEGASQERGLLSAVTAGLRTSSAVASTGAETQFSLIPEMQHALRGMMLPEDISQGDTQADAQFNGSFATRDTSETLRAADDSPSKYDGRTAPTEPDVYRIHARRAQEIKSKQGSLRQMSQRLAVAVGSRTEAGNIILCQCGHAKEEGDMVKCAICDTWQHLHCYGFTGSEDSRLPKEHICYWCLLGESNVANYKALQQLALERRGMYRVCHKGMRTKTDLANDLVLDQQTARDLWTEIKTSPFVAQTAKSHKAGFRATGQALYVPVRDGPQYTTMFERYFDPMTHIGEHYHVPPETAIPTEAAAFQQRLNTRHPASMAPPATPRTAGNRKSMSATPRSETESPASGLDLPVSRAMFETPTLTARRQTRVSKRPLEPEENDDSPAKRTATPATAKRQLVSYITKQMIDAGGESSPFSAKSRSSRHVGSGI